jgi:hypothetical protein
MQMETKQIDNNEKNKTYNCQYCDYNTCKIFLLKQHFRSKKHIKNMNTETDGNQNMPEFKCDICNKIYTNRSGLWKHKKICIKPQENNNQNIENNDLTTNNNSILDKEYIVEYIKQNNEIKDLLLKENKELKNQLKQQNEQIMELIPKVGNNNNNNNTVNQKFNISLFLNEKCKDAMTMNDFVDKIEIKLNDLLLTKENGIVNSINEIITENINQLSVYERPIHCTDKKRETLYIKNEKWEKDINKKHSKGLLKALQLKQIKNLDKWKADNPNYEIDPDVNYEYMKLINKCTSSLNEHEKKLFKNLCTTTYLKDENLLES